MNVPMTVRISSDGGARDTRVCTEDGQHILATAVAWQSSDEDFPTAEVTLALVPIEVEGIVTRWHGLEDVPSDVLRDELSRREDDA